MRPFSIGAWLLVAEATARAAAGPPPEGKLSIEEALERAEAASPIVRRAHAERMVVAASRVGAAVILPFNPVAAATAGHRWDGSTSDPKSQGVEWSARLEQAVEIAGQRGTRIKEADRAIEVALTRERFARAETRARMRAAYLGALIAASNAAYARRHEELGRRLYDSARARVQAGAASEVEVRLAEVERGRLAHARLEAELGEHAALLAVRQLLLLPADAQLELTTPLDRPAMPSQPLAQLLDEAQARRADLQALEKLGTQLDATISRLRREVVPSPTLWVEAGQQQPGQTYVYGGVAVPLPVWQRNQGPLAIARAERERAATELELAAHEVSIEVVNEYRAALTRAEEAELWDKQILPAAETNVELVSTGWRAGKFDLFRVIVVSREAAEARRKQLEVLGQLWEATIALARATGAP